jgi:excisionase family DNA binding protein
MSEQLLTALQLAERLHVRERTVQAWARKGRIPTVRLSSKVIRFDWQSVLAALKPTTAQAGGGAA